MDLNKLIARVKAILFTPKTEWPVIAGEPATTADLYRNYIMILAAIPAIFGFLKFSLLGVSIPFAGHGARWLHGGTEQHAGHVCAVAGHGVRHGVDH